MNSGFEQDPHSEQGHACPRNRFGIVDYTELQAIETPLIIKRSSELRRLKITGRFDIAHLRAIHKHLFQDVFPWAGEFRVVNISKGDASFGPARFLDGALADIFSKLAAEQHLRALTATQFAQRAGYFLGEINAVHPFREGNGRTQREFIRQLAIAAGHPLSWAGFTQLEMTVASIASHRHGDASGLERIVYAALVSTRGAR